MMVLSGMKEVTIVVGWTLHRRSEEASEDRQGDAEEALGHDEEHEEGE